MTSFRNISQFVKELDYNNNNDNNLRKYSIQVNNVTLDKLLTGLVDEIDLPDDDDILKAVYTVGKNSNSHGQSVWVLNNEVAIDKNGQLVKLNDFGFEWLGNLTEGDGVNIARDADSCTIHTPLSTESFDIMCHFLAGSLPYKCRKNALFGTKVNLVRGPGLKFSLDNVDEGVELELSHDRSNFLSQFFLASQAIIFANFPEVSFQLVLIFSICRENL
jgi:hypothetical protein